MTPSEVIGFVIEAIQKTLSRSMGFFVAMSARPTASKLSTLPSRASKVTEPDSEPSSTNFCIACGIPANLGSETRAGSLA